MALNIIKIYVLYVNLIHVARKIIGKSMQVCQDVVIAPNA